MAYFCGEITANTVDILGNLQFNSVSGALGEVLTKTGASTQSFQPIPPASVAPGLANQVYVTDATGTNALFANDIDIPGQINAGVSLFAPVLEFTTRIEGPGTLRAGNLLAPMWNLSTPIDINSGTDVLTLTTLTPGLPFPPLLNFTFAAGTFTSALEGNGEVTLSGAISTDDGQAILSYWKNGTRVRSFYTPPPVTGSIKTYPINFSHPLTMTVGDTFYVTQTALSGGSVNLLGVDVNTNAQTTVQFKFLGL
jgi:hypothetical protein